VRHNKISDEALVRAFAIAVIAASVMMFVVAFGF
jgi:hypothetical protein